MPVSFGLTAYSSRFVEQTTLIFFNNAFKHKTLIPSTDQYITELFAIEICVQAAEFDMIIHTGKTLVAIKNYCIFLFLETAERFLNRQNLTGQWLCCSSGGLHDQRSG